jgi:hypothetical protein
VERALLPAAFDRGFGFDLAFDADLDAAVQPTDVLASSL